MTLERHYNTPWVRTVSRSAEPSARLICFPYAAGSANIFRHWHTSLPEWVEVCAIQLPGRADRREDRPFGRLLSLVEVAANALTPLLDRPFAIFGHSMGALIAFELARLLEQRGHIPGLLMPAGRGAPDLPDPGPALHAAPERSLVEELMRLGGTSREMFADQERMARLIPIVRADFAICETYAFHTAPLLACPIVSFGGSQDPDWPESQIDAWGAQTQAEFSYQMFPSDHFFLHSCERKLLTAIRQQLERHLATAP